MVDEVILVYTWFSEPFSKQSSGRPLRAGLNSSPRHMWPLGL